MDTGFAVQMIQSADLLIADVKALRKVIARRAREHKFTPMIGRSHGIHAEPMTFGMKMAVMFDEFGRALERLESARQRVAVGKLSGAVGTSALPKVETNNSRPDERPLECDSVTRSRTAYGDTIPEIIVGRKYVVP